MKLKYHKKPLPLSPILQKYSLRYTREEALGLENLPAILREYLTGGAKPEFAVPQELPFGVKPEDVNFAFSENGVTWIATNAGAWRVDPSAYEKDKCMYFGVHKYIDEPAVLFACSDGNGGAWLATENQVVHLVFLTLTFRQKADYFDEVIFKYISRRGMTVRASLDENGVYKGRCSDNDGLWTSMVTAALCFRYAVTGEEKARVRATECAENMLLLATISGRKGYVNAKVRYSEPMSNRMSEKYLLKGRPDVRTIPEGGPYGMKTGYAGPANPEDWATEGEPELVRRRIQGFVARSYHVASDDDPVPYEDGTFFRKMYNKDGKLVSVAQSLKSDDPVDIDFVTEVDSSLPVPDRLARHYRNVINPKTGKGYGDDEIIYKADTSTDELIGHFFAYAIAYRILCTGEKADTELGQLFKDVINDIATHLAENDYCLCDAGGQPTSWGKMNREYFTNPYAFEDCTLNSLVLLCAFKVAAYITGDPRWEAEYRKLALDPPYQYADMAAEYWARYEAAVKHEHPELTGKDLFRAIIRSINYSDHRMGIMAYYTLLTLEDDPVIVEKLQAGIREWWRSASLTRDIQWHTLYPLLCGEPVEKDAYGDDVIETAAWVLQRHPLDLRQYRTDNRIRPDVGELYGWTVNKRTGEFEPLPCDERGDIFFGQFNIVHGRVPPTLPNPCNFTMPYWMGLYHGLFADDGTDKPPFTGVPGLTV